MYFPSLSGHEKLIYHVKLSQSNVEPHSLFTELISGIAWIPNSGPNLHLEDEPWVVVEGQEFEDAKLSGTECQRAYRKRTEIASAMNPLISYGRFNSYGVRGCDTIECVTCQEPYLRSDLAALTGFFPPAVGFNCPRCQNRRIVHAWTTNKMWEILDAFQ